ncbi:thioredoxin-like protein HCF164, chloroplastic isoform X2 [Malania oleifera]|nr:thioredoxin-like protein HCF164, chloroplastic isoform X2 [Malania oleifera]XP_057951857.1 thioredoxin-like protein HCF164, chloroplastic isoform X2 [Malania oleifera]XP_057951866.1 thioredoxin-like protein HCF164, chloroplastic isoform X2 [Malania oleifera]XP_057951873.1 thioredoxin-like protein HCF164, chloroplastic isoform X2 [Malania oleifera]XP_057951881.1 thioredoxin-like protein HCF164, chloroplastic isoform X2 [Malania oleifera]
MAFAASNLISLHRFSPCIHAHQSRQLSKGFVKLHDRSRIFRSIACQTSPDPVDPTGSSTAEKQPVDPISVNGNDKQATGSSTSTEFPEFPDKIVNKQIAVASVLVAVGLFLSTRLDLGISLKDLSATALPYEEALSNGKPTVVEFYADWCEVCRELAPDVYRIEEQYKDRVNFVMMNVDNTKWEQELDEFGVEGIPHFAFLDMEGNEEGNVVGRFPRQYFLENVDALARGEASIPHARVVGQYSSAEARKVHQVVDPRSHG